MKTLIVTYILTVEIFFRVKNFDVLIHNFLLLFVIVIVGVS